MFEHVNQNDVPYTLDDEGEGPRVLFGGNPIEHEELLADRRSRSWTSEGHIFHEGTALHDVYFGDDDYLYYVVTGRGSGGYALLNLLVGFERFLPGVIDVLYMFSHPPNVWPVPVGRDPYRPYPSQPLEGRP